MSSSRRPLTRQHNRSRNSLNSLDSQGSGQSMDDEHQISPSSPVAAATLARTRTNTLDGGLAQEGLPASRVATRRSFSSSRSSSSSANGDGERKGPTLNSLGGVGTSERREDNFDPTLGIVPPSGATANGVTRSAPAIPDANSNGIAIAGAQGDFYSSHSLTPARSLPATINSANATGSARFRASAQRLIRMRRLASHKPGSEPGVDPIRDSPEYDHIVAECKIDVVDYGVEKCEFREFGNKDFIDFLSREGEEIKRRRVEGGAKGKMRVRWINVRGIDWGVMKALSLVYGLHPLALEDVLHARDCRSKADYYKDHLFVQGLALLLADPEDPLLDASTHSNTPMLNASTSLEPSKDASPRPSWISRTLFGRRAPSNGEGVHDPDDIETGRSPYGETQNVSSQTRRDRSGTIGTSVYGRRMKAAKASIDRLRGEKRVKVKERNLYMFMFRDGTLITLHETMDSVNDQAIKDRLKESHTVLRGTSEVSVLLQSLLDLMVDHAIEVVDAFQDQILYLEQETLLRPHMDSVKLLHMLSADITLHKRTLTPLQTLVYGMRRYDLDRCLALAASASGTGDIDVSKVKGFMSHQSKVYLADVHDHLEYVLASLEMFETVTENLISYSFNALSYDMNQTMRRLTLATIIFFPLTFLTGYFGMNFTHMSSIEGSDVLFWKICVPCLFALILLFTWSDVVKAVRYVKRRSLSARVFRAHMMGSKGSLSLPM